MHKFYSFILSLLLPCSIYAQGQTNLFEELQKVMHYEYNMKFEEKEGIWVGVIDGDSTFVFSIGNIEADSLAIFQLGSLTKVFTHKLVSKLSKEKNLDSETKITDLIELDSSTFSSISINDLLTHQSGLPKHPYFMGRLNKNPNNPYSEYPDDILVNEMNSYSARYKSHMNSDHHYSHLNSALLGLSVHSINSMSFCQSIENMLAQNYPSLSCSDESKLTYGYNGLGEIGEPWLFPGFAASEGLAANILDLLAFVRSEIERPQEGEVININKGLKFQAPWYITKGEKKDLVYNFSGRTDIHSSYICFNPNKKTGVVLLRNSGKGVEGLPHSLLHLITYGKKKNKKYDGKK